MKSILVLLSVFGFFCLNQKSNEITHCDKLQILLNDVFQQKIYIVKAGDDRNGYTYLESNKNIPEEKMFILPYDTIVTYNRLNVPNQKNESDYLKFDFINFNEDTTFVKLSVFFSSKKGAMLTSRMVYTFVSDSCKWKLEELSYLEY